MVHNVRRPDKDAPVRKSATDKRVEKDPINDQVTLRRTTIEEIEVWSRYIRCKGAIRWSRSSSNPQQEPHMDPTLVACVAMASAGIALIVQIVLLIAAWRAMEAHQQLAQALEDIALHMRRSASPPARPPGPQAP